MRRKILSHNSRTNIIIRNVAFSTAIRGVNILISLILVPLTINYVTAELYGIWLSLSSIVAWSSFLDFGFGLGMRNRLTTAIAFNKYNFGKILVSTTYLFVAVIFFVVGIVGVIGCKYVDWAYLLNISPVHNKTVVVSFQIVVISYCLRMVLQLISNVCQAYQMTALGSFIDMLGQVISLIFMLILVYAFSPNLVYLSATLCLASLVAYIGANFYLFQTKFKKVSPSLRYVRLLIVKDIARLGGQFFFLQIIVVVLYQTTNFIISHYCGPEQVSVYNVSYRYLNVALMLFTILQSPVWSAFSEAYAKKDFVWMKSIYRNLLKICVFSEVLLFLFVMISPYVYKVWIGDAVYIPFHISLLMGVFVGLNIFNSIYAAIINGMGKLRIETLCAIFQPFVFLPLVMVLADRFGLEGIIVSLIAVNTPQIYFIVRQVNLLLNQKDYGLYSL